LWASVVDAALIDTATTDRYAGLTDPSALASPFEFLGQFRNLTTGGSVAADTGSGLTAFSATATAFTAWTSDVGTIGPGVALIAAVVLRGLHDLADVQAVLV
jgi:hypothetical protein